MLGVQTALQLMQLINKDAWRVESYPFAEYLPAKELLLDGGVVLRLWVLYPMERHT